MSWGETPTLVGRHVMLRPLVDDDREALVAASSADDLWDTFYASVAQLKDPAAWFERAADEEAQGRSRVFAVVDPGGIVVGTTRLMRMNPAHRRLEIGGTFYARRVQRTGVNTDAKRLLLGHAFAVLGCQCVQLRTDFLNKRSQTAIERLGARRDGVLRGHQIVDGRLRDTVTYSILDREWPEVRRHLDHLMARHD